MNTILLSYLVIGPTFKKRMITNLLTSPSYKLFDILILTDDPAYFEHPHIQDMKNVYVDDIRSYIQHYPEFHEHEIVPASHLTEQEYKQEILKHKFPLNLQRFALKYKNIKNYEYIAMLDCDVIPYYDEIEFEELYKFLQDNMPSNSVTSNRAIYFYDDYRQYFNFMEKLATELNIDVATFKKYSNWDNKLYSLVSFDNPLKLLKINNIKKIEEFFKYWNYVLLKLYTTELYENSYFQGSWNTLVEGCLPIVYAFSDIEIYLPQNELAHHLSKFITHTFPEDRFWANVTNNPDLIVSGDTQEEFININKHLLKNFYEHQGLKFPYE
jgi:hypothetical protein